MITLFYMVPGARRSGAAAYVVHLTASLSAMGIEFDLRRVGARTSDRRVDFVEGVKYATLSMKDAVARAKCGNTFILYSHFKHYREQTLALIEAGSSIAFHAMAELHAELMQALVHKRCRCVAIRESIARHLRANGVDVLFIPHPYIQCRGGKLERTRHAVNLSRLDFCKHSEVMVEANALLPPHQRIELHGEENRMYAHHVLDAKYPEWRDQWHGPFDYGQGLKLARESRYVVDLTYLAHDGGGTQYTFLEAWDAGATLVVHNRWLELPGPVVHGVTAMGIGSHQALADVMRSGIVLPRPDHVLAQHVPEVVVPKFLEVMQ